MVRACVRQDNCTPLHWAVEKGDLELVINLLLDAGADQNERDAVCLAMHTRHSHREFMHGNVKEMVGVG